MGADALAEQATGLSQRPETIRSFVAVPLPESHWDPLGGYLDGCRRLAPDLRWVTAENLHLTVRFLGNLDAAVVDRLEEFLRRVPVLPFTVRLAGLGSFGRGSAARVVWIGVEDGRAELAGLAAAVEGCCAEAGLEPETRPYSPHLTLARARQRKGAVLPELPPPPELPAWTVTGFNLYRSRTGPGGAVYTVLASFPVSSAR